MKIDVHCPDCGKGYSVDPKFLGRKVKCKVCETSFLVEKDYVYEAMANDVGVANRSGNIVDRKTGPSLDQSILAVVVSGGEHRFQLLSTSLLEDPTGFSLHGGVKLKHIAAMFPKQVDVWSLTAKNQVDVDSNSSYANTVMPYGRQNQSKKFVRRTEDSAVASMGYLALSVGVAGLLLTILIGPLRLFGFWQLPVFSVIILIGICLVFLGLNGQFRKSLLITLIPGLLMMVGFLFTIMSLGSLGRMASSFPQRGGSSVLNSTLNSQFTDGRPASRNSNVAPAGPAGNASLAPTMNRPFRPNENVDSQQHDNFFKQTVTQPDRNSPPSVDNNRVDLEVIDSQSDFPGSPDSPRPEFSEKFAEAQRKMLELQRKMESEQNPANRRTDVQPGDLTEGGVESENPFEQTIEETNQAPGNIASQPSFPAGQGGVPNGSRNMIQEMAQHRIAVHALDIANRRLDHEFKTVNSAPAAQKRYKRWIGTGVGDPGSLPLYAVRAPFSPVVGASILVEPSDKKISVVSPHYSDMGNVEATFRAPEGFVITGLNVTAGEFVTAIQFVCHRQTKTGIDSQDLVTSDWFGEQSGAAQSIGGDRPVVGFWLNDSIAGLKGIGLFRDPKQIIQ